MSQVKHSGYESNQKTHQHSEEAKIETEFGLSWKDFEMDAKLSAVGTAVSEGAAKLEAFMEKILELTKVVAVMIVACVFMQVVGALIKSKL